MNNFLNQDKPELMEFHYIWKNGVYGPFEWDKKTDTNTQPVNFLDVYKLSPCEKLLFKANLEQYYFTDKAPNIILSGPGITLATLAHNATKIPLSESNLEEDVLHIIDNPGP
jgi:hypothetical protein